MITYTKKELDEILRLHKLWLENDVTGVRANLEGSNLAGAYLAGANLEVANLSYANLSFANLSFANLEGANLSYANLDVARLDGANNRPKNTILQVAGIGSARRMTTYWVEEDKVWCGCFYGTFKEFKAKVKATHGDSQHGRDYKAAIAFFNAVVKNQKECVE